jgi:hypothetical protein
LLTLIAFFPPYLFEQQIVKKGQKNAHENAYIIWIFIIQAFYNIQNKCQKGTENAQEIGQKMIYCLLTLFGFILPCHLKWTEKCPK